jgi:hypothetical protein
MLHSILYEQFALVSASQRNNKGDYRSRDDGKVIDATLDDKDNLFCDLYNRFHILGKLVGDFMVVLQEIEEVIHKV